MRGRVAERVGHCFPRNPIHFVAHERMQRAWLSLDGDVKRRPIRTPKFLRGSLHPRSEEHTSELQSRSDLVCRLLLEKKKNTKHCGSSCSTCSTEPSCCSPPTL